MLKKWIFLRVIGLLALLLSFQNVYASILHDIPAGDFSLPNFPDDKPAQTVTGGQWSYSQLAATRCDVIAGDNRHAEISLDWGNRSASITYTDTGTTPVDQAWRISADVRAYLIDSNTDPDRSIILFDSSGNVLFRMKFFPDKTVNWSTPTQSGTFTSSIGIDSPWCSEYRRAAFEYDPSTGIAKGFIGNELVFNDITTTGLSVKKITFYHYSSGTNPNGQGRGTFYFDNVKAETIVTVLHDIPVGDFSLPNFPDDKPAQTVTGGQWSYSQLTATRCDVIAGDNRHAEISLDWGNRAASITYTDTGATPIDQAWRISADVRASLIDSNTDPDRSIILLDSSGSVLFRMKFFPDRTVDWSTPTQSGTFTSSIGIDSPWSPEYRRAAFEYDPLTGFAKGVIGNELVFNDITTTGLSVNKITFYHYSSGTNPNGQGRGTFYFDNVKAETIVTVLHDIPAGDFSLPNFPDDKPVQTVTGGQWSYYQPANTGSFCDVKGTEDDRHAEIYLDWGNRAASITYIDTGTTPVDQAWRISADIRAGGLIYGGSPERSIILFDSNGSILFRMKFFPDKTVAWSTPTQSGTFTSAVGIDAPECPVYRRAVFEYNPVTGLVMGFIGNELVFRDITTTGLSAKKVMFYNGAIGQGLGSFYIDNVKVETNTTETILNPGDVNCDGFVDSLDSDIVTANLNLSPACWRQGDVNGDGIVDNTDLSIVNVNLGQLYIQPAGLLTEIVPEPKQVYNFNNQRIPFLISSVTNIVLDVNADDLIKKGAALLQEDFATLYGLSIGITYQSLDWGGKKGFVLCNNTTNVPQISANLHTLLTNIADYDDESYRIAGDSQGVIIDSPASSGLFYGMQTLRQMLRADSTIPASVISDWPDQIMRVCYLGAAPGGSADEELVRKMARLKINMCIIESKWYAGGNWWYNPYGDNRTAALTFMALCREYNIEPVPLVQGFGHAYGVLDIEPNCGEGIWIQDESKTLNGTTPISLNNPNIIETTSAPIVVENTDKTITYTEGTDYQIIAGVTARPFEATNTPWQIVRISDGRIASGQNVLISYNYMEYSTASSYCPSEPITYQKVDATLQNVINIYNPKYIHIGHDEVFSIARCSRCQQSGKTALQLIDGDITHWYNKLKELNSNIKVMMWDDLLRTNATSGSAIASVPNDVIICPWVYGWGIGGYYSYDPASRQVVADRLDWFLTDNERPTLGAASGYAHENIWDWKDFVNQYTNNSNCQGFMFTWWGEAPPLWSMLSYAAEYMWSRTKSDMTIFDIRAYGDRICRSQGIGLTLSLYDQRNAVASLVNNATGAGLDARTDADTLASKLNPLACQLKLLIIPELASVDIATGTIPERILTQLEALPAYYWSMGAYVQAKYKDANNDKAGALDLLNQITARFVRWHFPGYENAASWVADYQATNVFPASEVMFDVTLTPLP